MFWLQAFKKGGVYEKVIKQSSWNADEWQFVRSNSIPSTQLEWLNGLRMSQEEAREAERARKKVYYESGYGKAVRKAYIESENGKAVRKAYIESDKGKAVRKAYAESGKEKASKKAYAESEKGKAAQKAYAESEKAKAATKAYAESEKGKATRKAYNKAYWQSGEGKLANNRSSARKKIKQGLKTPLTTAQREALLSLGEGKLTASEKRALGLTA